MEDDEESGDDSALSASESDAEEEGGGAEPAAAPWNAGAAAGYVRLSDPAELAAGIARRAVCAGACYALDHPQVVV